MFKSIILLGFVVVAAHAETYRHELNLNPGDEMKLRPQLEEGPAESIWNFEACEGCKIVLSCVILSRTCDDHLLTIHDGEKYHRYCGPDERYVLRNSIYNKARVSIRTTRLRSGSYCHVSTTKPYTNMKYEEIDSSEHCTKPKKQTSCRCGWANKSPGRIIDGKKTAINEFPFIVLIMLTRRKFPFCGGSIITREHVLTAAHCTYPLQGVQLSVIVGEHDIKSDKETPHTDIIDVLYSINHPNYDDKNNKNDVAVMKLSRSIKFSDAVGPACLPNFTKKTLTNEYIKAMGWGNTRTGGSSSSVLLKVNLKAIDIDICKTVYRSIETKNPTQICTWAPGKDTCQGDSGGPLVWRDPEANVYRQVALVSYGRECGSTDPAVNTDVSFYMDWIKEKIRETSTDAEVCV
uniref:Venom S1 protease 36 n=1 Tax=Ectomocoris sp. TaxID=3104572 RepID=A0AB38ZEC6_9HEMI